VGSAKREQVFVDLVDMDRFLQVQYFGQRRKIVGVRIHVIAVPRLARATVAAP
jgi:hypothetical protein